MDGMWPKLVLTTHEREWRDAVSGLWWTDWVGQSRNRAPSSRRTWSLSSRCSWLSSCPCSSPWTVAPALCECDVSGLDSCVIARPLPLWTLGSPVYFPSTMAICHHSDGRTAWSSGWNIYIMQLMMLWNTGTVSSWLLVSRHSPHCSDGGTRHAPATGVLAMLWSSNMRGCAPHCSLSRSGDALPHHRQLLCSCPRGNDVRPRSAAHAAWTPLWVALPLAFILRGLSGLSLPRIFCSSTLRMELQQRVVPYEIEPSDG